MYHFPISGADTYAVISAAFSSHIANYKLILKSWYGNPFARSIFNIKAYQPDEIGNVSVGGTRKMKVTRMGIGKVRTPYAVPLEGKTLAAIARHTRSNRNRMRRTKNLNIRIPKIS